MDANLKTKWVEALRSGKYEQGEGRLFDGSKHCCLGVLCDISGRGQWNLTKDFTYEIGGNGGWLGLPEQLQDEASLSLSETGELWRMNDGVGGRSKHSFAEIADHIEANL